MKRIYQNYDILPPVEESEYKLIFEKQKESLDPVSIKLEKPNKYNRNKMNWSSWKAIPNQKALKSEKEKLSEKMYKLSRALEKQRHKIKINLDKQHQQEKERRESVLNFSSLRSISQ